MAQPSRTRTDQGLQKQALEISLSAEDIAERAYTLYIARGAEDSHDIEDWLEAERQLSEERSAGRQTKTRDAVTSRDTADR